MRAARLANALPCRRGAVGARRAGPAGRGEVARWLAPVGPRVTILDVAREAGVSISTVSHVVNGTKKVSPEARRRVEQAVERLRYRPSHLARSLRRRRSATVGLLLAHIACAPVNALLKGVVEALAQRGYTALLADSEGSAEREAQEIARFLGRDVDGCIVEPAAVAPALAGEPRVPFVLLGAEPATGPYRAVVADCAAAVGAATEWALGRSTRVGLVVGHVDSPTRSAVFRAYVDAFRRRGTEPAGDLVCTLPPTPEGGYKAVQRLMRLDPPVSAAVVPDPLMALGALEMWQRAAAGARRPALVVADAGGWYPGFAPHMGRIVLPSYDMGVEAVRLLDEAVSGASDQEGAPDRGPDPGRRQARGAKERKAADAGGAGCVVRLQAHFVPPPHPGEASDGGRAAL